MCPMRDRLKTDNVAIKRRKTKGPNGSKVSEAVAWTDFIRIQEELLAAKKWQELLCWVIGGYTAFRVSDFCQLTWGEIMGDEKINDALEVEERKKRWMSQSARKVVFGEEAKALIEECRKHLNPQYRPDFYLFRHTRGPKGAIPAMTRSSINKMLTRVAKQYDLHQQVSPHSLRKCCALRVWQMLGGTDQALMYVSMMLCHKDVETTRRYLGITQRVISQIYRNLAKPIMEPKPGHSHIEALYAQINGIQ